MKKLVKKYGKVLLICCILSIVVSIMISDILTFTFSEVLEVNITFKIILPLFPAKLKKTVKNGRSSQFSEK